MNPLSVIIISKNEEVNIAECLESIKWAHEIIIVDAESSDNTVKIAKNFTKKVFVHPWQGFVETKNYALSKTSYDWVLWLDADERVTDELRDEIIQTLATSPYESAFDVARRAFFLGKWIRFCGWYPQRVVRLFNKNRANFSPVSVHEGLDVNGAIGFLKNDLLHFTDPNIFHYMEKLNRYTTLASRDLHYKGRNFYLFGTIFRAEWQFFKMYIMRLGFLDGTHGLLLSLLSSYYVFTKYMKLWERQNQLRK